MKASPSRIAPRREANETSPFAAISDILEELSHLPERLRTVEAAIERLQPCEKELLTVKEVEERWGISDTKLYQLIARGEIRAIKIDRATRIPSTEMRRWLALKLTEEGQIDD